MDTRGFSNRLLVDYRLLTYRGKHLASGLQVETIEWFSNRISPLSNFVWLCTWDYMYLWLQPYLSLKRVLSSISYLMTGKMSVCLQGRPLEFPCSSDTHRAEQLCCLDCQRHPGCKAILCSHSLMSQWGTQPLTPVFTSSKARSALTLTFTTAMLKKALTIFCC